MEESKQGEDEAPRYSNACEIRGRDEVGTASYSKRHRTNFHGACDETSPLGGGGGMVSTTRSTPQRLRYTAYNSRATGGTKRWRREILSTPNHHRTTASRINHLGAGAAAAGGLYAAAGLDTDPGADTLPSAAARHTRKHEGMAAAERKGEDDSYGVNKSQAEAPDLIAGAER